MKILFHSVNGIGLGHLNRLLIIAKAIRLLNPAVKIHFATESKFTKPLEEAKFIYTKLPYTHCDLANKKISRELMINKNKVVMKKVIEDFNPNIIVYDTYPFYGILNDDCSLNRINVLVLRKIEDNSLKNLLENSIMDKFQLIIFPHEKEEFNFSPDTLNELSKMKFFFSGPITKDINLKIIPEIKKQYKITNDKFNVLVAVGGGGKDDLHIGANNLLKTIEKIASLLKKRIKNLNLIVITGPYYKGHLKMKNSIIKEFEKCFVELLKSVDLVISTAGYNTCNEIRLANTPAILVPVPAHIENQKSRALDLEKNGLVKVLTEYDKHKLVRMILNMKNSLGRNKSHSSKLIARGDKKAAKEILRLLYTNCGLDKIGSSFEFNKYEDEKEATILIPTHNREKLLKPCLISLFKQDYPKNKYEIVIVDDGTDNTEKMIKTLEKNVNVKYYKLNKRMGRSIGRNVGIKNSEGKVIIFIDSDMILDTHCIRKHIEAHKKIDKLVLIGYRFMLPEIKKLGEHEIELITNGKVKALDDLREVSYSLFTKEEKENLLWKLLYSNNTSVKKKHLITVGMFDENITSWGTEDVELGFRLHKLELKFIFDRKITGYHQYHQPEYVNMHGMLKSLGQNYVYIYDKHKDKNAVFDFAMSYNYELINIGKKCNNNCSVCEMLQKKDKIDKTIEQIKKEIKMLRLKSENIIISGGEPTIKSDVLEIISYIKKLRFKKIALDSNGRMFSYQKFCEEVIRAGATEFNIYLCGHDAKTHDHITGVKGSFEQTLQGIKNLSAFNQDITIKFPINMENYKYLFEAIKLFDTIKIKSFVIIIPRMVKNENMIPPYVEIAKELSKTRNCILRNGVNVDIRPLFV